MVILNHFYFLQLFITQLETTQSLRVKQDHSLSLHRLFHLSILIWSLRLNVDMNILLCTVLSHVIALSVTAMCSCRVVSCRPFRQRLFKSSGRKVQLTTDGTSAGVELLLSWRTMANGLTIFAFLIWRYWCHYTLIQIIKFDLICYHAVIVLHYTCHVSALILINFIKFRRVIIYPI